MSASIPQIVGKQVRVVNWGVRDLGVRESQPPIKALPDEIFGLIMKWLLPVKPKVCGACKTPCVKPNLMKSSGRLAGSIKRANYCNACWCSRLKCAPFIKIKDHFTDELTKHLYPTDTVIKSELQKRSNKITGEWRLITNGKWLFDTHKQRKTQEKVVFYERLLSEGIKIHGTEMVRILKRQKDLANAPMRTEILSKALAKRFANNQVSYEYFIRVVRKFECHYYAESEMTAILKKWDQIDSIKVLTHNRSSNGVIKWMTNKESVWMFTPVNGGNNYKCFEFCGYWNSTTHSLDYEC